MTRAGPPTRRRLPFERRILVRALLIGLPGGLVALFLLWTGDFTLKTQWTLTLFIVLVWTGLAASLRNRVVFPLQTLSNLISAVREGDYSIRARGARRNDSLGEVFHEVNLLSSMMHDQRLDALEATTLLRKIMEEIEVAVFAFDADRKLRLVNRAGERLLARPSERLMGRLASELGLEACLKADRPAILDLHFAGGGGRWEARRSDFRQGGLPLQMLVLSDLSRALRQEERLAWRRLIRVLGHELNNSLAPIRSLAGSLGGMLKRRERPGDWEEDLERGLSVIGSRAESLNRFMEGYARLARLPAPKFDSVQMAALVQRVASLETRLPVQVQPGPELEIRADPDQLEQLLINLLRNAVDASLETGGGVSIGWSKIPGHLEVHIDDEGPGLPNTANLFVPFFTTKPKGTGIGLVLSRQIAEAHGGTVTIQSRRTGPGCQALLRLPVS